MNQETVIGHVHSIHPALRFLLLLGKKIEPWLAVGGFVVFWEILASSGFFPPWILPKFSSVVVTLYERLKEGELGYNVLMSMLRVFTGFLAGTILGTLIGFAFGWSKRIERIFNPVFECLRPIPPMAWIPLTIIWLGVGFPAVVFITFMGAFFPILVNTIHGVKSVETKIIEYSRSLGATPKQALLKVIVPSTLPVTFVGMRIGLGVAWMTVVTAEMTAVKGGMGFMIWKARFVLDTEGVIAGMIGIGILSVIMARLMIRFEDRLFRWQKPNVGVC